MESLSYGAAGFVAGVSAVLDIRPLRGRRLCEAALTARGRDPRDKPGSPPVPLRP